MFEATNAQRSAAGRSPLSLSASLTAVAQAHAEDMARRQTLSHTGGDGSDMEERVRRVNYRFGAIAENVASHSGSRNAARVVNEQWMNSEGHRRNMLNPEFTEVGIGYASNGNSHYYVQVFGRPQ